MSNNIIISTPLRVKTVDEYDFIFVSGTVLPVTIDHSKGDSIFFGDKTILITLTPKESLVDPTVTLPGEDIVVHVDKLLCHQHRSKQVQELTPEQKLDLASTFHGTNSPTVN